MNFTHLDNLFSLYIRKRDKGRCVYRFKCNGYGGDDPSHFQKRRKLSVRFDGENVDCACRICHDFVHTSEGEKVLKAWKLKQLGPEKYRALIQRANRYIPVPLDLANIIRKLTEQLND